jgi:CRP-like cAMP-binding protein
MEITEAIQRWTGMRREAAENMSSITKIENVSKDCVLVQRGHICREVYIVDDGSVRAFHSVEGEEKNFWIGAEGSYVFSPCGTSFRQKSPDTIVTIEYSKLLHFGYDQLIELCEHDNNIANWWRRVVEIELVKSVEE